MAKASPAETKEEDIYKKWFWKMAVARSKATKSRQNDEEMFFADVEGTRTQLTKKQLDFIETKYDVPISTKVSYAILEQILSFLTGAKPYPRLIAPSNVPEAKVFATMFEQAHNAVWYESRTNAKLTRAIRDMLVVGSGFMLVRRNSFFDESTFNVIHQYIPWCNVFIDPNSRESDFSDAEHIVIASIIPRSKAEKEYDITLSEKDYIDDQFGLRIFDIGDSIEQGSRTDISWLFPNNGTNTKFDKNNRHVLIREHYEKIEKPVYISDEGYISAKKPIPITIPNPDKEAAASQIQSLRSEYEAVQQQASASANKLQADESELVNSPVPSQTLGKMQQSGDEQAGINERLAALTEQIQQAELAFVQMPEQVPAYEMQLLDEQKKIARGVVKNKKKIIQRTLWAGDQKVLAEIMPIDRYPLIHLSFSHRRSPNLTYGMMHFIVDIVKALNKFWSSMIYDVQIHNNRKVLAPKGSIENQDQWEQGYSMPGAVLEWTPNASVQDAGKPEILEPSPLNQGLVQLISMLMQLAEYITGIWGVVQGNPGAAPETAGGTNSMLTFGTQRVKLYGRHIEESLQDMAYVTVGMLQAYAPRNKALQYFDDDDNPQEIAIMDNTQDLQFKVRVSITNSLPTARHMAAQLLATISGQTGNKDVADLVMQNALRIMDLPEGPKMADDIDVIKRLQSTLQQIQQQLDAEQKKNKMLESQNYTSELAHKKAIAEERISNEADRAIEGIQGAQPAANQREELT